MLKKWQLSDNNQCAQSDDVDNFEYLSTEWYGCVDCYEEFIISCECL